MIRGAPEGSMCVVAVYCVLGTVRRASRGIESDGAPEVRNIVNSVQFALVVRRA